MICLADHSDESIELNLTNWQCLPLIKEDIFPPIHQFITIFSRGYAIILSMVSLVVLKYHHLNCRSEFLYYPFEIEYKIKLSLHPSHGFPIPGQ